MRKCIKCNNVIAAINFIIIRNDERVCHNMNRRKNFKFQNVGIRVNTVVDDLSARSLKWSR